MIRSLYSTYKKTGIIMLVLASHNFLWQPPLFGQHQLDHYLKLAESNHPQLQALYNQYQASLEKIPQVATLPDPQVSLGYFTQPIETRVGAQKVTVGVSQSLPWFGTLKTKKTVEEAKAQAQLEAYEEAKQKVFFQIKDTYYQLYYLEKAIGVTQSNLALLTSMRELAEISFESGKSSLVDVFRLELEAKDLISQLAAMNDSREATIVIFEHQINASLPETPVIPDTLWNESVPFSKEEIEQAMISNSHKLKMLDRQYEAFGNEQAVAEKLGMPSFTVSANYINIEKRSGVDFSDNGKDALLLPQVGIRIPLYRKKYQAMVNEAGYKREAVSAQISHATNQLVIDMEKVYANYQDAARRVALNEHQADLAARSLDLLQTSFATDGKNFDEVLRMNRKVLDYQLALEKARSERNRYAAYINYLIVEPVSN